MASNEDPLGWLRKPGPRHEPEAAALYRERAQNALGKVNPYWDEDTPLQERLMAAAEEIRSMFYHDEPDAATWKRYAVCLLDFLRCAIRPLRGHPPPGADREKLTNVCTDLRHFAGMEPAQAPYRNPEPVESEQ